LNKISSSLFFTIFVSLQAQAQLPPVQFHHLKRDVDILSSGFTCLTQDDFGFIWFGSYHGGGLYRFDGYEVRSFVIDPSNLSHGLTSNRINDVNAPGDNHLYISTHGGWNKLDLLSGKFQAFANSHEINPEEGSFYTTKIILDSIRRLWISSYYGLAKMQLPEGGIEWLKPSFEDVVGEIPERIRDLAFDRYDANHLWLGSYHGLFNFDIRSNKYTYFPSSPKDINAIAQDADGTIWISSYDSTTLYSFESKNQLWQQYDLKKILPGIEYVNSINILDDNQIWVSSKNHVGKFDPQLDKYDTWQLDSTNPDGLLPQGNYFEVMSDRHGRLWIGSWYGIQYTRSAFAKATPVRHPVTVNIIELKSVNERADKVNPLIYSEQIKLIKDQRDFEIKYVLPNPLHPSEVEYQYMLEGYDRDWITSQSRTARYSRIPGGSYAFKVRAREDEGNFGGTSVLQISIEKKLLEFWWFWILSAGSLAGVIMGGLWLYIGGIRKEEKLKAKFEQDMAEVKMQALRAQMNPHFLFNCLNSIKYYAISKDKHATADYLSKFSLLVRTILNNSKSEQVALNDEIEAIRLYIEIENLRLEDKFKYEIEIDPSIEMSNIQIPPMVLQPYVENAIWHGLMHKKDKGKLTIQVKDVGNKIQCIIEDNGVGRRKSSEIAKQQPQIKKSMGMQITSDRLKLIREIHDVKIEVKIVDLEDEHGHAAGTRVVVVFPYQEIVLG